MQWIMTISATCLIAQMPAAPEHPHPHKLPTNQSPTDSEPRSKPIAAQWVAAMYPGAAAAQNPGRALPLVDVLKAVEDRSQQIAAVQAYWRLATAIAAFQAALEDVQRVEQFARRQPPGLPSAAGHPSLGLVWNARLAAARARLSEAQVAVTVAEQDISARIGLPANKQPLPSDLPLVSAYKTYYDQLSAAGRAMPVEARLIDRLLPLRREAIELEAAALQASVDWLDATDELSQRPSSDFENATTTLVAALDEIVARQAAFVAAVERYNDEIAVYALPLAAEGMRPEALAAMLVKAGPPSKETGATATTIPSAFDGPGAATPATFNESIDSNRVLPRAAPQMPRAAEPAQGPGPVEVRKPLSDAAPPASTNPGSGALFAGFEALSAARRAQELAANLHWDRAENPPLGKPISLDECMTHASLTERAAAIAAYWNTSRWTAQLQAANDCAEQLAALLPLAMRPAEASAEPEQMLRLREARLVADAAIVEARCELLKSQFTLGLRTHQSLDGPWPTAATRPHGGGYRLTSEVPSTAPAAAVTVVRRAAEVIPRQQTALEEAATALVLTDAARTGAIASYANGTSGLALAVEVVGEQAAQSEAFLDTLARYNTEIGQYVLAIMPSDTNAGSLAAAMVVTHERR